MTEILALPKHLRRVPDFRPEWEAWRDQVLVERTTIRALIEKDLGLRREVLAGCFADPCYDQIIFRCHFEPRDRMNRARGWYPTVPFEFQVRTMRFIVDVVAIMPGSELARLGRSDAIVEKARDMTFSWTLTDFMANRWLYDDGFVGGLMSYNEDMVEKSNDTGTLFYKLEGSIGLDPRVPILRTIALPGADAELDVPVRPPDWMVPEGYDVTKHNQQRTLAHPTKTNVITGFTTTERATTGARLTVIGMDEAAKFAAFMAAWLTARAVTDHVIAGSSPDVRWGTGFRDAANHAREANERGDAGPSFLRLEASEHPYRDEIWREEIEARHSGSQEAADSLDREYGLNYNAGIGSQVYPDAEKIQPKALLFNPANESLDFCIDPGHSNMCAFHLVKYDPAYDEYGVMASYANAGKPAEFYASLACASPISGRYVYGEAEEEIMEWFDHHRRRIRFWIGDPAGKARTGAHRNGKLTSFYDDFAATCEELTAHPIHIYSSDKAQFKQFPPRMAALRWLLPKLQFNDVPQVRRTRQGILDHRFPSRRNHRESTSEDTLPVRHPLFDRVTALEYLAAYHKMGFQVAAMESAEPERLTMSGKAWGDRKRAGYSPGT